MKSKRCSKYIEHIACINTYRLKRVLSHIVNILKSIYRRIQTGDMSSSAGISMYYNMLSDFEQNFIISIQKFVFDLMVHDDSIAHDVEMRIIATTNVACFTKFIGIN